MNRRHFLKTLGLVAGAVSFGVAAVSAAPSGQTGEIVSTDGWSANDGLDEQLRVGDIFTIQGRYAFNPVTRRPTKHLQSFMVTAVTSSAIEVIPQVTATEKRRGLRRTRRG